MIFRGAETRSILEKPPPETATAPGHSARPALLQLGIVEADHGHIMEGMNVSSPECEIIREAIRSRIKELGISQTEAAGRANWKPQRLWNLLNDNDEFLFTTISPLLKALGLSVRVEVEVEPVEELATH